MPASHSVGSLFVNISGSSKGLKRALSGAKKDLSGFQRSMGGLFGSNRMRQAQAAMSRAGQRRAALESYATRGPSPVKGSRQGFAKEMKRVLEEQGAARTEMNAATLARNLRIGFAAIGLGVGAFVSIMRHGVGSGRTSLQRHQSMGALGPSGGRFITARVEALLARIRHAMSPEGSEMQARAAEREKKREELDRRWERVTDQWSEVSLRFLEFITPRTQEQARNIAEESRRAARDRARRGGNRGGFGVG